MKRPLTTSALLVAALLTSGSAHAKLYKLHATLDAKQAGSASTGTGDAEFSYDDADGLDDGAMQGTIVFRETEALVKASIHQGAPGATGAEIAALAGANEPSPLEFTVTISKERAKDVLAGNSYVLLTSGKYPNGELRGQITVVPDAIDDGGLTADAAVPEEETDSGATTTRADAAVPATPTPVEEDDGGCSSSGGPIGGVGAFGAGFAAIALGLAARRRQRR